MILPILMVAVPVIPPQPLRDPRGHTHGGCPLSAHELPVERSLVALSSRGSIDAPC
jgi:hypothetical protein